MGPVATLYPPTSSAGWQSCLNRKSPTNDSTVSVQGLNGLRVTWATAAFPDMTARSLRDHISPIPRSTVTLRHFVTILLFVRLPIGLLDHIFPENELGGEGRGHAETPQTVSCMQPRIHLVHPT